MKTTSSKNRMQSKSIAFNFLTEILKRRLRMRIKLIKHRRNFMRKQLQQSFHLFQNSILNLFQTFNADILQITLQNLDRHQQFKNKEGNEPNLEDNASYIIRNFDETNREEFLNYCHITSNLFYDICEIWPQEKYKNIAKHLIHKIANCIKGDRSHSENSIQILKSEEKICVDIIKHFGYTCDPMMVYECEEAKQKFSSLCGLKICGILVEFALGSDSDKNFHGFAIVDHKKRFRCLTINKLPTFLKYVENHSFKKSSNYFFSNISETQHIKNVLYYDNIGKDPCAKLVSFKQDAVNQLLNRWTYLNGKKCNHNLFQICIILHNLCKNRNISMP